MKNPGTLRGVLELRDKAIELFDTLKKLSGDEHGITRECYSSTETAAINLIADTATRAGLNTEIDAAGNLWVELAGADRSASVVCGSHLDSVPHGGNFDGAAGVVAGLLALLRLQSADEAAKHSIKLVVLRAEEGAWFGKPYLGSRALLGKLRPEDLQLRNSRTNLSLSEQLVQAGLQPELLCSGKPLIDPTSILAFFELHIEQGPVLVNTKQPFAIVTGIRGNIRNRHVVCRGEEGHSGAVPRGFRHDALTATADLLMRMDKHWAAFLEEGRDLVVTSGVLHTDDDNAITRIPGQVSFSLDVRSLDEKAMRAFYAFVRKESALIAEERGVMFEYDEALATNPVKLDGTLMERLARIADSTGFSAVPLLASGAGHDAAVFAESGIPTAMIFVRNRNGSHNPHEAMDIDDFMCATELLYRTLAESAWK